jgi:hypothetical protein
VPERSGPPGLARRASAANATTESGGEAETKVGSGGVNGWARAAQLAEPERASHSAASRFRTDPAPRLRWGSGLRFTREKLIGGTAALNGGLKEASEKLRLKASAEARIGKSFCSAPRAGPPQLLQGHRTGYHANGEVLLIERDRT